MIVVIYLFLGNARSALIPAVTMPVCLVTAFTALWAFGFSINLLTLLALVLCIGLVVDDAIVVVENIQRRADLGEPPLVAARRGTAQVAFAVIATTAVLVAVFLPVGFMEGNTGPPVPRAVGRARERGRDLLLRRADADADDVLEADPAAPRSRAASTPGSHRQLDAPVGRLPAPGRRDHRPAGAVRRGAGRQRARSASLLFTMVPKELAPAEDRGAFFIIDRGARRARASTTR